jgi:hypothetical protein
VVSIFKKALFLLLCCLPYTVLYHNNTVLGRASSP